MRKLTLLGAALIIGGCLFVVTSGHAWAVTDCSFTTVGTTDNLDGDCTTDETIFVSNGQTLDGGGIRSRRSIRR